MRALALVLPVALALAAGATGADDIDQDEALALRRSGELQPLESLLARVRELEFDARSGELLQDEEED